MHKSPTSCFVDSPPSVTSGDFCHHMIRRSQTAVAPCCCQQMNLILGHQGLLMISAGNILRCVLALGSAASPPANCPPPCLARDTSINADPFFPNLTLVRGQIWGETELLMTTSWVTCRFGHLTTRLKRPCLRE